jgi:hypothetical protein
LCRSRGASAGSAYSQPLSCKYRLLISSGYSFSSLSKQQRLLTTLFLQNQVIHYLPLTGVSEVTNAQPLSCKYRLLILFSFPAAEVTQNLFPENQGYSFSSLCRQQSLLINSFLQNQDTHYPSFNQSVRGYSQSLSCKYRLLILFSFLTAEVTYNLFPTKSL